MQGTQVQSLGPEDPLEKEMATHSSILACKIPWAEEHEAAWEVYSILGILVCPRLRASLGAQMVKNLPAMQETWV